MRGTPRAGSCSPIGPRRRRGPASERGKVETVDQGSAGRKREEVLFKDCTRTQMRKTAIATSDTYSYIRNYRQIGQIAHEVILLNALFSSHILTASL